MHTMRNSARTRVVTRSHTSYVPHARAIALCTSWFPGRMCPSAARSVSGVVVARRRRENERRRSWIACWLSIRTPKTPLRRSHRQDYARLVEAATSVAVDPRRRRRPAARASIDDASRGRAGSCVAEGGRELRHCATRPFSETMIVPLAS
jgi:hypothetical protein